MIKNTVLTLFVLLFSQSLVEAGRNDDFKFDLEIIKMVPNCFDSDSSGGSAFEHIDDEAHAEDGGEDSGHADVTTLKINPGESCWFWSNTKFKVHGSEWLHIYWWRYHGYGPEIILKGKDEKGDDKACVFEETPDL